MAAIRIAAVRVPPGARATLLGSVPMPDIRAWKRIEDINKAPGEKRGPHSPPPGKIHLVHVKRGLFTITILGPNGPEELEVREGLWFMLYDHPPVPVADSSTLAVGQHSSVAGPEGALLERYELDGSGFDWKGWNRTLPRSYDLPKFQY